MGANPQTRTYRPVDVARRHGLSTQAVRNYEAAAILPAAARTPSGYRAYTPVHALALDAFVALVSGHGHQAAAAVMAAVHRDAVGDALEFLDAGHTQLVSDRRTLRTVTAATAEAKAGGILADLRPVPAQRGATTIGPLAARIGVEPATLRAWERAGIVTPARDPLTGFRRYGPDDVRDVLLAHQLRRGGYLLERIAAVIARIRAAGGVAPVEEMLGEWPARLVDRGRAMLRGAAALHIYLDARSDGGGGPRDDH